MSQETAAPSPPTQVAGTEAPDPSEVLLGLKAQRRELGQQLSRLEDQREEISSQLRQQDLTGASRAGLEKRLAQVDERLALVDQQIADADIAVARASAVPGAVDEPIMIQPPPSRRSGPPEEAFALGGMFIVFVMLPISIAYARRIWRRSAKVISALPSDLAERFGRLEQAVDSIAVEVERIGEGQRFMTRVLADNGVRREAIPASLTDELDLRDAGKRKG